MSGVFKGIKKVFKKVTKAVKKVLKNPIVKAIVVAAAVYFTVGTASAFFANPSGGLLAAAKSTASSMWSSVTSAFSGTAGSGAAGAASSSVSGMAPTVANATVMSSPGAALTQGVETMNALGGAGSALSQAPAQASGIIGKTLEAGGKFAGWLGKNPGAAMVLGQGVSGGVQSYQAGKAAEEQREYEDQKQREKGFFGMDQVGNQINLPTTGSGLIGSAMAAPTVARPATQTEIAQQGGATGAAQPQQVAGNAVDPYSLTPAQFLEYQRRKLMPDPYGVA